MFLTIYKLESRLEAIEELRYDGMIDMFPLAAADDTRDRDTVVQHPPQRGNAFEVRKNDFLVGRDRYIWLEKNVTVPEAREGFDAIALFDLGETCEGFSDGFESIIYVNEQAFQGVDSYHNEVFFPADMTEAQLQLMVWSGLEGGGEHRDQIMHVRRAEIGYLHIEADAFYYLVRAVCQTWHILADTDPIKNKLLNAANDAIMALDLDAPRAKLYPQIAAAYSQLTARLGEIGKTHDVTVYCVGHSHIDVAWLWRVKHTKEKCLRSFSTVLRLMDRFEDYQFIQSQPQLYRYVKDNYPAMYAEIKQRVAEGRFEPNGGMWVEADCNLISGESMVRQFLYGDRFFREEFGKRSNCLWLPDVFGYSWAMPQVLRQCGIDTFMTTKISWNEYNKIPHDTFMWKGMDGTEILTHFITAPNEDNPDYYTYFTYNGFMEPVYIHGTWDNYKDKGLNQELLMAYGYGDGGGGPTRQMLMSRRAMDQIPGLPHVKNITAGEYFDKLQKNAAQSDGYLHTWADELYFENHRGTYTSQAYNKRMNRHTEGALQIAEALGVLAVRKGGDYQSDELRAIWELVMLNQFHDIIPGSAITEVYEDCRRDYTECVTRIDALQAAYLTQLLEDEAGSYTVWNTTAFDRVSLVRIDEAGDGRFECTDGTQLGAQRLKQGWIVRVPVRALAMESIHFVPAVSKAAPSPFIIDAETKTVETPFYCVHFGAGGEILSLFDKENGREVFKSCGNQLVAYEDRPVMFDAWNVDYDHYTKFEIISDLCAFEVLECGALTAAVRMDYRYHGSTLSQIVRFYCFNRRIDFETVADWHETHRLVKACFDTDVFAAKATYDIQFGNLERNTHHSTSWDWAKFEVCAHKWIDLSESGYGVAVLNDCKYGHSVRGGKMTISLIKCATWPDTTADIGAHSFTYSLLPHASGWREADVQAQAEHLNQPLIAWQGVSADAGKSLVRVSADSISIDAVKQAEDGNGIIVRLHEFCGGRRGFILCSDYGMLTVTPVNMLEEATGDTVACAQLDAFITPYEIQNYRITLQGFD